MDINNLSPEDLNILEDMFGKDSPALAEQIRASRNKALDILGKPAAQDIVNQASVPGKTAAQAAETLAPKQLPTPIEGPTISPRMAEGMDKLRSAASGSAGEGVIEAGGEIGGLPAARSGLPAVQSAAPEAIETTGRVLGEAAAPAAEAGSSLLSRLGGFASKAALPATMAYEFLKSGPMADPSELPLTPVPGRTDVMARGPDLVPVKQQATAVPPVPTQEPSLFDRVSAKYKEHTPEMTQEEPKPLDGLRSLMKPGSIDSSLAAKVGFGDDKSLDRAMKARDKSVLVNQILKGLELASSGISGTVDKGTVTKPMGQEAFDQNIKQAEKPVQDVLLKKEEKKKGLDFQRTMEDFKDSQLRRDPSSMVSVQVREALKSAFPQLNVPDTMSAEQAKDMGFNLSTVLRAMEMKSEKEKGREQAKEKVNNAWITQITPRIEKKYDAMLKIKNALHMAESALTSPNATKDVAVLYSFIKGLDPDSVVREGEINLARKGAGLLGSLQLNLSQISANPKLLTSKMRKDIFDSLTELNKMSEDAYNNKLETVKKQAKNHGIPEDQYDSFIPGYSASKTVNTYPPGAILKNKKTGKTFKVREDGQMEEIK